MPEQAMDHLRERIVQHNVYPSPAASSIGSAPTQTLSPNQSWTQVEGEQTRIPASTASLGSPPWSLPQLNIHHTATPEGQQSRTLVNEPISQGRVAELIRRVPSSTLSFILDVLDGSNLESRRSLVSTLLSQLPSAASSNERNDPPFPLVSYGGSPTISYLEGTDVASSDAGGMFSSSSITRSEPVIRSLSPEINDYGVPVSPLIKPKVCCRKLCTVYAIEVQVGDILKWGNPVNDNCEVTAVGLEVENGDFE